MIVKSISLVVAILIVVSKFLDCYSTVKGIKHNPGLERNPLARFLMKKIGFNTTIWSVFAFTVIISALSLYYVFADENQLFNISFIVIGFILSILQFLVVHSNITDNENIFTKKLNLLYNFKKGNQK